MKITFIKPCMCDIHSYDALPPLSFAILSGLTPKEFDVELYDERIEKLPDYLDTNLIAMTVETYTAKRAYQIANYYRKKGIKVVMGGFHPTALPDESSRFADAVVIGEAENVWNLLLDDLKKNQLKKFYKSKEPTDLTGLKYHYDIFKNKKYPKITPVQFSRGCKYHCNFCSVKSFYGSPRYRPIRDIIEEIKNFGSKIIFFVDDNIFFNKNIAILFFKSLIPLKIKWSTQVSIDITQDDELLELMAKSGCVSLIIGFESFNLNNLKLMNKYQNIKYHDYRMSINKIKSYGIMIYGTFIFGYDNDEIDNFREYIYFVLKHKFFLANFNPLIPMPGTKLYSQLKKENRLLYNEWWLDDSYRYGDPLFIPKNLNKDDLCYMCYLLRMEFNSIWSIMKRAIDFKANCHNLINLITYFVCNFISRKQIKNKQGKSLGRKNENYIN